MRICSIVLVCLVSVLTVHAREFSKLSDLVVTVSSDQTAVTNGTAVTVTVTARNLGPDPITDGWLSGNEPDPDYCEIQLSPADGQYIQPATASGPGSINTSGWTILWFPGEIAAGAAVHMTATVTINTTDATLNSFDATGHYSNSDVTDTNQANNADSLDFTFKPAAALSLSIDDDGIADSRHIDDGGYWLGVVVSNSGPSIATDVVVTNILPAGADFSVSWPDDASHYDLNENVLTWRPGGDNESSIWPGTTETLVVDITPTSAGEETLTSTLFCDYDSTAGDDTATRTITVTNSPVSVTLGIEGWDIVPTVNRYGSIQYYLHVYNDGDTDAENVVVSNMLPLSALYDRATPSQGTVSNGNEDITWFVGTVAAQSEADINLYVIPLESGVITNVITLHSDADINDSGATGFSEETSVNPGPPICTVMPLDATNSTLGFHMISAVIQTNNTELSGINVTASITRGPHAGYSTNAVTAVPTGVPDTPPPMAIFELEDELGLPGLDRISVTGTVGRIPFNVSALARWELMSDQHYLSETNAWINNDTENRYPLRISESFDIYDIRVKLHLTHSWPSDLEFRLESAEGSTVTLFSELLAMEPGETDPDMLIGTSNQFCVLKDNATTNIAAGSEPFAGDYQTESLTLGTFTGETSRGEWTLIIEDMNPEDDESGRLYAWGLDLTPDDGDIDNDNMNDQWELDNGLDPTNPNDADLDGDHDGSPNWQEFRTGSKPAVPGDTFSFSSQGLSVGDDEIVLEWRSQSNAFYTVERSFMLLTNFTPIVTNIMATPPLNRLVLTNDLDQIETYYRVVLEE